MTTPAVGSTWAVFSTYRPTERLLDAVARVLPQVAGVVISDDGSGTAADDVLARAEAMGVTVRRAEHNAGIAAALNAGIALARERGAAFLVTFDQDSFVTDGFIAALIAQAERAADRGVRVGAVVPEVFAGVRQAVGQEHDGATDARNVIQSGMLLPVSVVGAVGALREDFFIDLVDTEYELRLRAGGYRVIAAPGLHLAHSLGTKYRRELFGRTISLPGIPPEITLSTPFRYFYRVRNRIVLNREYARTAPRQLARDTVLELIHAVTVLWVARPRRAMLRIMRAGVVAALRGRMGRMPAALVPVAASVHWAAPEISEGAAA